MPPGPLDCLSVYLKSNHINVVDSVKQIVFSACVSMCSSCMHFHVDAVLVHCLKGAAVLQLLGMYLQGHKKHLN